MKKSEIIALITALLSPTLIYLWLKPYYGYWYDWTNETDGLLPLRNGLFANESYLDLIPALGLVELNSSSDVPFQMSCSTVKPDYKLELYESVYKMSSSRGEVRTYVLENLSMNMENLVEISWNVTSEGATDQDVMKVLFGHQLQYSGDVGNMYEFKSGMKANVTEKFKYETVYRGSNQTLSYKARSVSSLFLKTSCQNGFELSLRLRVWKRRYAIPDDLNLCPNGNYQGPPDRAPPGLWIVLSRGSVGSKVEKVSLNRKYSGKTVFYHKVYSFAWNYCLFLGIVLLTLSLPLWPPFLLAKAIYDCLKNRKGHGKVSTENSERDLEKSEIA